MGGPSLRRLYEEHWRELPRDPEPWRFARRRDLLLGALHPGERWLDLGCGAGRFTALAPDGIGVDIAEAALERARENVPGGDFRRVEADGTLPLGHGEVSLVWCSETIEHVPDALGLLQEARRVLAPGGRLLLTTPGHPLPRRLAIAALRFDAHYDPLGQHLRFFTRSSLRRTLAEAGFDASVRGGAHLVARAVR
jgi:SAM-dependent methyltransferase